MTIEFNVPEVSCQHCVNAITKEVSQVDGVHTVAVDLGTKRVRIDAEPRVSTATLVEAINEAGYEEVSLVG